MFLIKLFGNLFGKAKLYLIAFIGIASALGIALLRARRAGAAAERRKQVARHMRNLQIGKEELAASSARTDDEVRQRLKDRQ
ncbi:MAG: hypothetical protein OEQ29_08930 [Alphaproteobacteria bacterium]|nr:hypothetical protein [Alphaproteobacteria bacterium]